MANTEAPSMKTTTLAPLSVRDRKIRSGTSGRVDSRPSMTRKTPSSASPAARVASVVNEPQPLTSVRTIP